jgi:hypothetical protein
VDLEHDEIFTLIELNEQQTMFLGLKDKFEGQFKSNTELRNLHQQLWDYS